MFSVEWLPRVENVSGRMGVVWKKLPNDNTPIRICHVQTWGMGSCAVAILQQWGYWARVELNEVDQFFEWLCSDVDTDWQPMEFYFMFSPNQKKAYKHFIKHPNVKLRDKFENKSHGPNTVFLYRYSKAKDFKRVVNKKG
jgi:hypothetical protein